MAANWPGFLVRWPPTSGMRALRRSPTAVTLALVLAVFACQQVAGLLGWRGLFALSNPLLARPGRW